MDLELGRITSVRSTGEMILVQFEAYEYVSDDQVERREINLTIDPTLLLGHLLLRR